MLLHNIDTFNAMSKGFKGLCYVHNIDTFNAVLKGVERLCCVHNIDMYTFNAMSKGSKRLCYVHNIDTFNAMLKRLKDYVMLKQGTYTSLLITFLIFNQFSIRKKFWKAETWTFPTILCYVCQSMLKGLKVISKSQLSKTLLGLKIG